MDDFEKNIVVNELFDLYGELLPEKQHLVVHLYYCMNLSLGEIAAHEKISRNAVFDALKKGVDNLSNYEAKLHLYEKRHRLIDSLKRLKKTIPEEYYDIVEKEIRDGI